MDWIHIAATVQDRRLRICVNVRIQMCISLVGETQTNTTVISAALRPYQGAVAAISGHINVHETGAIEATGHKIMQLPSEDGKISAVQVEEMCHAHLTDGSQEHMVQPGMVYIYPRQKMEHCIRRRIMDLHEVAENMACYSFLTEHVWDMD